MTQAAFIDTIELPPTHTEFISPHDILYHDNYENDNSLLISSNHDSYLYNEQEEALHLQPNSVRIDVRSGKVVSFDLSRPILPGDGVGNHLLWRVGTATFQEDERSVVMEREEWGRLGVEAVRVRRLLLLLLLFH